MQISEGKKKIVSGDIFQFPATLFFQISLPFLILATDSARPTLAIIENRIDRFFQQSISGYSTPPPDASRSSLGWVENRPMDSPSLCYQ